MPKFVIERTIENAGEMSAADLCGTAQKSNDVLAEMGGDVNWVQSYVTQDKLYCVYIAPDAERVREHARRGGFPADSVEEVRAIFDPTTAAKQVALA